MVSQERRNGERGAVAVEFALVATLLVILLFGVIEGGRLFAMHASLSAAVREAARDVAIGVEPDPQDRLDSAFLWGSPVITELDECPSDAAPADNASARVEVEFVADLLMPIGPNVITLGAVGVMRCGG